MKRRIYTPVGDSGILQPIELGGTNANNAKDAAKNLNLLTYGDLNKPNNAVTLSAGGFIDKAFLPHDYQAGNKPLLDGLFFTFPNGTTYLRITNFDSFTTYNLESHMGTVTRHYDTLAYRAGPEVGAGWIKVNGHHFPIEIRVPRVTKPVIVYPLNNAENVPRGRFTINASAFHVAAYDDEHVSTDWQLSRDPDFSDLIINNINDTLNKTNIHTPELHAERKYYIRVRYTARRALQSEWSDTVVFTTSSGILRGREIQKIPNDREKDDDFGVSLAYAPLTKMLEVGSPARNVSLNHECGAISQYTWTNNSFTHKHHINCYSKSKTLDLSIAPAGYVTIHYPELNVSDSYLSSQTVQTREGVRTVILEGQGEHLKEKIVPGRSFKLTLNNPSQGGVLSVPLPSGVTRIRLWASYNPYTAGYSTDYYNVSTQGWLNATTTAWQVEEQVGGESHETSNPVSRSFQGGSISGSFTDVFTYSATMHNPINGRYDSRVLTSGFYGNEFHGGLTVTVNTSVDIYTPTWGTVFSRGKTWKTKITSNRTKGSQTYRHQGIDGKRIGLSTRTTASQGIGLAKYIDIEEGNGASYAAYRRDQLSGSFQVIMTIQFHNTQTSTGQPEKLPTISYTVNSENVDIQPLTKKATDGRNYILGSTGGYIVLPKNGKNKRLTINSSGINNVLPQNLLTNLGNTTLAYVDYEGYREPYVVVKPEVTGNGSVEIPVGTKFINVVAKANDEGTPTTCSINGEQKTFSQKGYTSLTWDTQGQGGTFAYEIASGTVAHIAYVSNEGSPPVTTQKFTSRQGSFTVPAGVTQLNIWAKLTPKVTDEHGDVIPGENTDSSVPGTTEPPKLITIKNNGVIVLTIRRGKGYEHHDTERETLLLKDDNQPKNFTYELPENAEITVEYGVKDVVAKPTTVRSGNITYAFGGGVGGLAKPSSRVFHMEEESYFGLASAISRDGTVMVAGAPGRTVAYVQDGGFHPNATEKTGSVFVYQREGDNWAVRDIIEPSGSDIQHLNLFGASLAITDNTQTIVIGSPMFDANAKSDVGRVEVYTYNQDQRKYVRESDYTSPTNQPHDLLGYSVDILGDKTVVVAGAPGTDDGIRNSGCVYVDTWITDHFERRKVRPTEPVAEAFFGASVKLCRDGLHLVVGAPGTESDNGAVYLFRREAGSPEWTEVAKITNPSPVANECLGACVAITDDAATIASGAPGRTGRAFNHPDAPWSQTTDSNTSSVYVFRKSPTGWELGKKITPSDRAPGSNSGMGFGASIAFSPTGDLLMVGAPNSNVGGAVYVYD